MMKSIRNDLGVYLWLYYLNQFTYLPELLNALITKHSYVMYVHRFSDVLVCRLKNRYAVSWGKNYDFQSRNLWWMNNTIANHSPSSRPYSSKMFFIIHSMEFCVIATFKADWPKGVHHNLSPKIAINWRNFS